MMKTLIKFKKNIRGQAEGCAGCIAVIIVALILVYISYNRDAEISRNLKEEIKSLQQQITETENNIKSIRNRMLSSPEEVIQKKETERNKLLALKSQLESSFSHRIYIAFVYIFYIALIVIIIGILIYKFKKEKEKVEKLHPYFNYPIFPEEMKKGLPELQEIEEYVKEIDEDLHQIQFDCDKEKIRETIEDICHTVKKLAKFYLTKKQEDEKIYQKMLKETKTTIHTFKKYIQNISFQIAKLRFTDITLDYQATEGSPQKIQELLATLEEIEQFIKNK